MPVRRQDADPVRLTADLVGIDSVNLGPEIADQVNPERKVVAYLETLLKRFGARVRRQPVRAGRCNVLATIPGRDTRRTFMLQGHMDTVGVEGMTVPPFKLTRKGNKLYGRGTCDTKGVFAAYLAGLARLLRDGKRPAWNVVFVGCMGEETQCEGSGHLAKSGFRADAGLIAEATHLNLCVAHKSALWWRARFKGRTAHGSSPHLGVSAVEAAAAAALEITRQGGRWAKRQRHPLLPKPTAMVGVFRGGEKVNVVPGSAHVDVDSRLIPGEDGKAYLRRATQAIRRLTLPTGQKPAVKIEVLDNALGFVRRADSPVLKRLGEIAREIAGPKAGKPMGGAFFSDAGPLAPCVKEIVVFGPGEIGKAHTPDEYMDADELEACTEIVQRLLEELS